MSSLFAFTFRSSVWRDACFVCGQVIILSSEKEVAASLPVGVRRTARHVCWAANGELVAAIVEFESDQAGFQHLASDVYERYICGIVRLSFCTFATQIHSKPSFSRGCGSRAAAHGLVLAIRGALGKLELRPRHAGWEFGKGTRDRNWNRQIWAMKVAGAPHGVAFWESGIACALIVHRKWMKVAHICSQSAEICSEHRILTGYAQEFPHVSKFPDRSSMSITAVMSPHPSPQPPTLKVWGTCSNAVPVSSMFACARDSVLWCFWEYGWGSLSGVGALMCTVKSLRM